jgi:hypothetical protein
MTKPATFEIYQQIQQHSDKKLVPTQMPGHKKRGTCAQLYFDEKYFWGGWGGGGALKWVAFVCAA